MREPKIDVAWLETTPPWEWPQNAGETLAKCLRDPKTPAPDRLTAAELAGDLVVMDDDIARLLLGILRNSNEPEDLRAKAAISLGPALEQTDIEGFDDDLSEPPISEPIFNEAQQALRKIHGDANEPKLLRRRALEASVRAPQDWHKSAISAAYSSGDEEWKLTGVFGMRWVGGFERQILETLGSPNSDLEYEAVSAAGAQEVKKAWPHILGLLESRTTEKSLLIAAIEAAGSVNPEEATPILTEFTGSEDEDIADAASDALAMMEPEYDDEEEDEDEED